MLDLRVNQTETIARLVSFIQETFAKQQKNTAVIAVSGGIDSALSLTLLTQALGPERVFPLLLPYARQDMRDAETILDFCAIPLTNRKIINIASMVDAVSLSLQISPEDQLRKGNVMARMRMIAVFDYAKTKDALVAGTENKSEHYLGYFTRFGDEASDLEPISTLYKTQVRQLAQALQLPAVFLEKAPSAGLWDNQSDEAEFGFTYELADQVLTLCFDQHHSASAVLEQFSAEQQPVVQKVLDRIQAVAFKYQVPYTLD